MLIENAFRWWLKSKWRVTNIPCKSWAKNKDKGFEGRRWILTNERRMNYWISDWMPVDLKGETKLQYGCIRATTLDNTDSHMFSVHIRRAVVTVMTVCKSSPLHLYSAMRGPTRCEPQWIWKLWFVFSGLAETMTITSFFTFRVISIISCERMNVIVV